MDFEQFRNFSIAATPGGIEQQEADGQRAFADSTTMPKKGGWQTLASWGVQRHQDADDLFCFCTLPEGWSKRSTDHSMWSELIDAQGNVRAKVFYKAAFYDRDAFFNIVGGE